VDKLASIGVSLYNQRVIKSKLTHHKVKAVSATAKLKATHESSTGESKAQLSPVPRNKWVLAGGFVAIFLICSLVTFFVLRSFAPAGSGSGETDQVTAATPIPTPEPPKPLTIVLLGYGGGNHEGGLLTDTIMLARIDPINKYIALISVPRDLWVPLPLVTDQEPVWAKINNAYAIGNDVRGYQNRNDVFKGEHGGGTLAKTILNTVTGVSPDYYAAVNFDAFTEAIDTIGPLTVTVPYTFTDSLYPIRGEEKNLCQFTEADLATLSATFKSAELEKQFTCRYETLHFDKGKQQMDGEMALKFVRSRHGDVGGSDFGRAQRQQALVDAVKQKVFSLSFIPRIVPLAQQMINNVQTDLTIADIPTLMSRFSDITSYELYSISLTDDNVLKNGVSADRQFVLQPKVGQGNWSEIQYYINSELKKAAELMQLEQLENASASASQSGTLK